MNILVCISDLGTGGIQNSFRSLLDWLISQGYSIDILTVNEDYVHKDKEKFSDVRFIRANKIKPLQKLLPISTINKSYSLNPRLRDQYDVIIDFEGYQLESAITASKIKSNKKIIWVHSDYYNRYKHNAKFRVLWHKTKSKYDNYEYIVFVSEQVKDNFRRLYGEHSLTEHIIGNIIDTEKIYLKLEGNKPNFSTKPKNYNLSFLGRMVPVKNLSYLLELFSEVLKNRTDIDLYLIGDGPEKKKLEKQANKLDILSHVFFLGNKVNPFPYLNAMDGIITVSNYEGQPVSLYEAVSLGLDVFMPENLRKINVPSATVGNLINNLSNAKKL